MSDYHTIYHTKWTTVSEILFNNLCVFHLQDLNSTTVFFFSQNLNSTAMLFLSMWSLLNNCENTLLYKLIYEMIIKIVDKKCKIEKFDFDVNDVLTTCDNRVQQR